MSPFHEKNSTPAHPLRTCSDFFSTRLGDPESRSSFQPHEVVIGHVRGKIASSLRDFCPTLASGRTP
jgi:hypothetical protein